MVKLSADLDLGGSRDSLTPELVELTRVLVSPIREARDSTNEFEGLFECGQDFLTVELLLREASESFPALGQSAKSSVHFTEFNRRYELCEWRIVHRASMH